MKVISIQSQINNVAERWKKQHPTLPPDTGIWKTVKGRRLIAHTQRIGERLAQLDTKTATQEDVADIIGNSSWVAPHDCDECEKASDVVVELGGEPGYGSATTRLCLDCLKAAVQLAEAAQKGLEQS